MNCLTRVWHTAQLKYATRPWRLFDLLYSYRICYSGFAMFTLSRLVGRAPPPSFRNAGSGDVFDILDRHKRCGTDAKLGYFT